MRPSLSWHKVGGDDSTRLSRGEEDDGPVVLGDNHDNNDAYLWIRLGEVAQDLLDVMKPSIAKRTRHEDGPIPDPNHLWEFDGSESALIDFVEGCWRTAMLLADQASSDKQTLRIYVRIRLCAWLQSRFIMQTSRFECKALLDDLVELIRTAEFGVHRDVVQSWWNWIAILRAQHEILIGSNANAWLILAREFAMPTNYIASSNTPPKYPQRRQTFIEGALVSSDLFYTPAHIKWLMLAWINAKELTLILDAAVESKDGDRSVQGQLLMSAQECMLKYHELIRVPEFIQVVDNAAAENVLFDGQVSELPLVRNYPIWWLENDGLRAWAIFANHLEDEIVRLQLNAN